MREDDGAALHVIVSDAEVSRWLRPAGIAEPISREEAERWAHGDAAHWRAHGFGPWLLRDGGTPVARGGLRHTLVDGRAEVEALWAVARTHWGRGVAHPGPPHVLYRKIRPST